MEESPLDGLPIEKYIFVVNLDADNLRKKSPNSSLIFSSQFFYDKDGVPVAFERPVVFSDDKMFQIGVQINAALPGFYLINEIALHYSIHAGSETKVVLLSGPIVYAFDGLNSR